MKLSGQAAARYFARPEPDRTGLLIYGADAMRVALKRQQVIAALIGPEGEAEMRLTRIAAADLRKDAALLIDAVKAQGFFPGPRVVFAETAVDALAPVFAEALAGWKPGDAQIVVTAASLNARSALRKLFDAHPNAYAVGVYDDPPGRDEIEAELKRAGLVDVGPDSMEDLVTLSRALDPGDFRQTVEKIGLYKIGDPTPLGSGDVALCAPSTIEAGIDDMLTLVADARSDQIGPMMLRLQGQGINAVAICIGAMRHFRSLHSAASNPGGPGAAIARMRPPVYGPRREQIQRQAQGWGMHRLEQAIGILVETDLSLRSSSRAPAMAVMERALIRLAMLGRR